jgi:hypothetical protein
MEDHVISLKLESIEQAIAIYEEVLRPDNASKAAEEYGRRQMNRLIRRAPISLSRLTGSEICQHSLWQIQLQHILDGEPPVLHHQRAT